ncbi:MAG: hypothetical protein ABH823_02130 [bacterium]
MPQINLIGPKPGGMMGGLPRVGVRPRVSSGFGLVGWAIGVSLTALLAVCGGEITEVDVDDDFAADDDLVADDDAVSADDDVVAADDDVEPTCGPLPIPLTSDSVEVIGFNGAHVEFVTDGGQEMIHFTATGARDAGFVIQPRTGDGWQLDCHTRLIFELMGLVEQLGDWARLDVQVYFQGDSDSSPSASASGVRVGDDWAEESVPIPEASRGGIVVKIQPLAVSDNANVDVTVRNMRFE